ncbi:hypothetical protein CYMTET_55623 [Cymbomonas tetramitiformis]|uniref:Uncharacterized protein n=1 Tax=Cymbomonas tetramitiformis TaxID=36881 RepID=A0AAE0BDV2_9CHLO|nr:hypothetical protein CYMTET_55623 [Cymbomonas tetramitiformis]
MLYWFGASEIPGIPPETQAEERLHHEDRRYVTPGASSLVVLTQSFPTLLKLRAWDGIGVTHQLPTTPYPYIKLARDLIEGEAPFFFLRTFLSHDLNAHLGTTVLWGRGSYVGDKPEFTNMRLYKWKDGCDFFYVNKEPYKNFPVTETRIKKFRTILNDSGDSTGLFKKPKVVAILPPRHILFVYLGGFYLVPCSSTITCSCYPCKSSLIYVLYVL